MYLLKMIVDRLKRPSNYLLGAVACSGLLVLGACLPASPFSLLCARSLSFSLPPPRPSLSPSHFPSLSLCLALRCRCCIASQATNGAGTVALVVLTLPAPDRGAPNEVYPVPLSSTSWVEFTMMLSDFFHAKLDPVGEGESEHARKLRSAVAQALDLDVPRVILHGFEDSSGRRRRRRRRRPPPAGTALGVGRGGEAEAVPPLPLLPHDQRLAADPGEDGLGATGLRGMSTTIDFRIMALLGRENVCFYPSPPPLSRSCSLYPSLPIPLSPSFPSSSLSYFTLSL